MVSDVGRPAVVIVDDLPLMRQVTRLLLTKLFKHLDILEYADGQAAWEYIQQNRVDLLIADIYMPNMGGLKLLEQIRSHPRLNLLPVILVTATDYAQDREIAIQLQANKIFYRPIPLKEFDETVKFFVGKESSFI